MESGSIRKDLSEPLRIDIHSGSMGLIPGNEDFDVMSNNSSDREDFAGSPKSRKPGSRHHFKMYARRSSQSDKDQLSPDSKEELRLRVNSRERQRMHDINGALDALRQVMPYQHGPSVKKLSKMSTLLLARNYIVLLSRTLEELRRLVAVTYGNQVPVPGTLAGVPPNTLSGSRPFPSVPGLSIPVTPHPALITPGSPSDLHLRASLLHQQRPPFSIPLADHQLHPELTSASSSQVTTTVLSSPVSTPASQVAEVSTTSRSSPSKDLTETVPSKKHRKSPVTSLHAHGGNCFCIQCLTAKH